MRDLSITTQEQRLIRAIQRGFPISSRPFREIGAKIQLEEDTVIARLNDLLERGVIKRIGVIVRHHELGFKANAMVVWNVPDQQASEIGHKILKFDFVTLCYRRRRSLPTWPYNLYCMIHGRQRHTVLKQIDQLIEQCGLISFSHQVLFSNQRFKQRGAYYI